jgi:hypothetical protein
MRLPLAAKGAKRNKIVKNQSATETIVSVNIVKNNYINKTLK